MALAIDTLFVGRTHVHIPQLPSTNSYAQDLINYERPPEGTVITTDFQESGRGQIGRSWYSSPNLNICTSIILYPAFIAAADQFQLSIAISISMRNLIRFYLPNKEVTIKWPNDLYVNDSKIAGILIQNTLKGSNISSSIIGIGLNINELEWPAHIPNPTSLARELGKEVDIPNCLRLLLSMVEKQYLTLKGRAQKVQRNHYLKHLYLKDREAAFVEETGKTVYGKIIGIDDSGRLVIDLGHETRSYQFREIGYVH